MVDTWTILRSRGPRLAKLHTPEGTLGYERAKVFQWTTVEVESLSDWAEILRKLESKPLQCVIRGVVREGITSKLVERNAQTFQDPGHHLIPLDLDDDEGRTVSELIALLPEAFHAAPYILQWTASHGIKPGTRCRLWFWGDTPTTGVQLKHALRDTPCDPAIFRVVQPIYTASPIFQGVEDPVERRTELIDF